MSPVAVGDPVRGVLILCVCMYVCVEESKIGQLSLFCLCGNIHFSKAPSHKLYAVNNKLTPNILQEVYVKIGNLYKMTQEAK